MKIVKSTVSSIVLMIACLGSVKAQNAIEMTDSLYRAKYEYALSQITPMVSQIAMYRDELTNIWHNAIIEGTYKGERCDDWNKAVNSYLTERNESYFYSKIYKAGIADIKTQIKALNKYPAHLEKAFNELLDLGILIDEFYMKVDNPDGSYNLLSEETRDLYTRIKRKLYELEMRYTD